MKSPGNSDDNISYSSASSLDIPNELVQLITEFDQAANSEVQIHALSPVYSRTSSPNRSI